MFNILKCADDSFYTGVTNDLEARIEQHNSGFDKFAYTFSRRSVRLMFSEVFKDPIRAINFEKQLKGWSRKKKEALIGKKFELLPILSRSKKSSTSSD